MPRENLQMPDMSRNSRIAMTRMHAHYNRVGLELCEQQLEKSGAGTHGAQAAAREAQKIHIALLSRFYNARPQRSGCADVNVGGEKPNRGAFALFKHEQPAFDTRVCARRPHHIPDGLFYQRVK